MILQYKGFNNNWTYIYADEITFANVYIGKESNDYVKDGIRYNLYLEENNIDPYKDSYYIQEGYNAINKIIQKETHCCDDIIWVTDEKDRFKLQNVCIVMISSKNIIRTYAFDNGAYMLNDYGKTIVRLA